MLLRHQLPDSGPIPIPSQTSNILQVLQQLLSAVRGKRYLIRVAEMDFTALPRIGWEVLVTFRVEGMSNDFAYGTLKYGLSNPTISGRLGLTGPGPGSVFGPHVRGWNIATGAGPGDVFGLTGPGPGSVFGPHVRGWNVAGEVVELARPPIPLPIPGLRGLFISFIFFSAAGLCVAVPGGSLRYHQWQWMSFDHHSYAVVAPNG